MAKRRDFLKTVTASLAFPSLLASCSQNISPYRSQIFVFGTQVDLLIYHPDKQTIQTATGKINSDFQQFHHEWHAWEKGGVLSKINQAIQLNRPVTIAKSVKDFILYSQILSQQSGYRFDPGIGQLISLWGFHSENWQGPPPNKGKITDWLTSHPSIADIYFDNNQLLSRNPNVQLDFGGNAKGLALDLAIASLQSAGIKSALVSIGGDMKALGLKPEQQAWQVAVQNPKQPEQPIASINLFGGESLVTSGTYQRYFDWQGERYSHLLDPKTGWPVKTEQSFDSVTVIHADAIRADSAASAILIAGKENWQVVANAMQIEHVFCIDHAGNPILSPKMQPRIRLLS